MNDQELKDLISKANARYDAMTSEQQDAMWKAQRDGYVKAEMSWPKPKFKWVDGVKVYESYEDYLND